MKRKPKTRSVKKAAQDSGFSRAWVSRLCQRGEIGTPVWVPAMHATVYEISEKDFRTLKAMKTQGFQKYSKAD